MRMTRIAILFLALAVVAGALPEQVTAQVRPFTVGISAGPSLARGHLAEEAGTGYHVQGSLGFTVPALPLGLRADLLWQELPDEHSGQFRQIGGLINGTFGLPLPMARPYALIGAGVISTTEPEVDHGGHSHASERHTGVGFNAGVGIEFPFLGLGGVLEARVLNLLGDTDHQSIPISFGIRF
jgi:hypothetical protein